MRALSWGLDVSTSNAKTAAVALDRWTPGHARVVDVRHSLPSADIAPLIAEHQASRWAVDVPFGWPALFVDLMSIRHHGPLPAEAMPAERPGRVGGPGRWRSGALTGSSLTTPASRRVRFQRRSSCSARPPRCGCWSRLSWTSRISGSRRGTRRTAGPPRARERPGAPAVRRQAGAWPRKRSDPPSARARRLPDPAQRSRTQPKWPRPT